jgi:predicted tellurium resistance membrane protein TerC
VAELLTVDNLIALATLTLLEIVLGIDNVVFLAILAGKLPKHQQPRARRIGLSLAMLMRIALLLTLGWIVGLTSHLFTIPQFWSVAYWFGETVQGYGVSGRDLIMLVGGLFLIGKATYEIHDKLEGHEPTGAPPAPSSFAMTILQIVLIDIVFSLDSVITAVGMVQTRPEAAWIGFTIMITAVILAVLVMLMFAGVISDFVSQHPTMKMLALSFLILIGTALVAEGFHREIPKGYVYFAMAFSLGVELLNLRLRKVSAPVTLHQTYVQTGEAAGGQGAVNPS